MDHQRMDHQVMDHQVGDHQVMGHQVGDHQVMGHQMMVLILLACHLYSVAVETPRDCDTNCESTLRSGHLGDGRNGPV